MTELKCDVRIDPDDLYSLISLLKLKYATITPANRLSKRVHVSTYVRTHVLMYSDKDEGQHDMHKLRLSKTFLKMAFN